MTLCVLDASVALAWAFRDEVSPYAVLTIRSLKSNHAVAPAGGRIDELLANRLRNTLDSFLNGLSEASIWSGTMLAYRCTWHHTKIAFGGTARPNIHADFDLFCDQSPYACNPQ